MKLLIPSLTALLAFSHIAAADPVSPAFTWQGRLDRNGAPANGSFDLKFELYNTAAAGNPLGTVELPAQNIAGGLFSADLNFGGPAVFDGTAYWLALSAKAAGAPDYVPVPGRTAIRPTPYAIQALSAASVKDGAITGNSLANGAVSAVKLAPSAVGLGQINTSNAPVPGQILNYDGVSLSWINATGGNGPWQTNGSNAFYNGGRVGIGTNIPANPLTIRTVGGSYGMEHSNGTIRMATFLGGSSGGGWLGTLSNHPLSFFVNDGSPSMTIDTGGRVGIGTTAPNHVLSLTGAMPNWTSNGWGGAIEMKNGSAVGWQANAAGSRFGIGQSSGGLFFFRTASNPGTATSQANYDMYINDGGNVVMTGGTPGFVSVGSPNGETGITITRGGGRADVRFEGTTLKLMAGPGAGIPSQGITVNAATGKVGIGGSTTPVARLEVVDQDALRLIGYQPFMTLVDSNSGYAMSRIQGADGKLAFHINDWSSPTQVRNVAVMDANGMSVNGTLTTSGNTSVSSLTIRGGADLAEPFAMSHDGVEPGTVVVIDEKNPGKLKASSRAYDKKVAGIVSGANGIKPGISMIQEDKLEAGENVALSGRVYVKADNSAGTIEPGDLLTTSSTTGRAMKAADHDRAQGAIIGKAMTSLNESEGMVLVLVTLQ